MKVIISLFFFIVFLDSYSQMPSKLDTIEKPSIEPYNDICYLYVHRKKMLVSDKWYKSTGFFINDSTLLTAAHNIHSPFYNKVDIIRIYPAKYYNTLPYDSINLELKGRQDLLIKTPPNYSFIKRKRNKKKWDFGIIKLANAKPLPDGKPEKRNVFSLDKNFVLSIGDTLNVAGYPADNKFGYNGDFMTFQVDTCRGLSEKTLQHKLKTFTGNSGSPIWVNYKGERIVVGVHTFSSSATLVDEENLEILLNWITH